MLSSWELKTSCRNFQQMVRTSDIHRKSVGSSDTRFLGGCFSIHRNFQRVVRTSDHYWKSLASSDRGSSGNQFFTCRNFRLPVGTSDKDFNYIYPLATPLETPSLFFPSHRRRLLSSHPQSRRFEDSTIGFHCFEVPWIPHPSETQIPSIFPPIHVGNKKGNSFKTPIARSINVERVRWILLGVAS